MSLKFGNFRMTGPAFVPSGRMDKSTGETWAVYTSRVEPGPDLPQLLGAISDPSLEQIRLVSTYER